MNLFRNLSIKFDRHFSKGFIQQVLWLVGIMAAVFAILVCLSYASYLYNPQSGETSHWYSRCVDILLVLIDPSSGNSSMSSTFTIVCSLIGLIIFSGMLISVISNVLERRVESFLNGETDYKVSNHVVVIGFNESIASLLREIHKTHSGYIVIMSQKQASLVREWIHAHLDQHKPDEKEIEDQLVIMNGLRNGDEDLDRLRLPKNVKEIYVLGETDEPDHDSVSMECVRMIAAKLKETVSNTEPVKCHVLFESQTMYKILQTVDVESGINEILNFLPFNTDEIWAQKVLGTIPEKNVSINGEKQNWIYEPLDAKGITPDSKAHVHLVIIGMNNMGLSLSVNAAHVLHFPNFKEGDFSTCSHITFVDSKAHSHGKEFRAQYRALFELARWRSCTSDECLDDSALWHDPMKDENSKSPYKGFLGNTNFMDIQWEFIEADLFDDCIYDYLSMHANNLNEKLTIALCGEYSEHNAKFVMSLDDTIMAGVHQILVRQTDSPVMVNTIARRANANYMKVKPFGINSECYYGDVIHEEYGKLVNACYSGIQLTDKDQIEESWKNLSVSLKWSSMYCANMLYLKLRFLGLDATKDISKEDIDIVIAKYESAIQRTEHNRWNTEKLLMGFRPLKSEEERNLWNSDKNAKKQMKSQLCHLDILSNEMLYSLDEGSVKYDIDVNKKISEIYQVAQQMT